jgi:hypothetical protein
MLPLAMPSSAGCCCVLEGLPWN